ncbi:uncharacterized protein LOC106074570 [Biomphalaria glabrata]|uniref:Uncharacterized protein LOC106074570 n=1 Tax=Biomphalaria glabrata TaxID=6526 RepID=A0A9W2ZFY1_BIOGL|nr:uncharacterized protein LOC106074570 [Biomphalaria glabrata]XP_013090831.2 uncharacterized protein LOC106074570 [Biomphalaria glabrata]XP_013090836.2 uncharacterized protein LOC106074570 [Biomphalaria glabrata]XP_013090854.2 uncharacterized protein LOC106074570 [Biomphalaria glabrata]XP_055873979.1 uncharacterized protein LOC106074570 [Biomphalaria glabrata]XP_055873985.1 uncharacterized protein LOC106074570 [Biomphalaria glabrata]XP_055873995.1 uncharacterized protein LOC106074570 [Biomph
MEDFELGDKYEQDDSSYASHNIQKATGKNETDGEMHLDLHSTASSISDVPRHVMVNSDSISGSTNTKHMFDSERSNEDGDTTISLTFNEEELDTYVTTAVNERSELKKPTDKFPLKNNILTGETSLTSYRLPAEPLIQTKIYQQSSEKNLLKGVKQCNHDSVKEIESHINDDNSMLKIIDETEEKFIVHLALEKESEVALHQVEKANLPLIVDKLSQFPLTPEENPQILITTQEKSKVLLTAEEKIKVSLASEYDKQNIINDEDFINSLSSNVTFSLKESQSVVPGVDEKNTIESKTVINSEAGESNRITKEFTVVPVPETELATDKKATPFSTVADKLIDLANATLLVESGLSTLSEGEINNQDTIGPLENPAFLRTLHYTESQNINNFLNLEQESNLLSKSNEEDGTGTSSEENPDLDRGWAWVILASSFFSFTLLGATAYAAGVFMSAIIQEVEPDLTKVSWVGSVNVCFTYLTGPFVGVVLDKLGARLTVSLAGVIVSLGFVGAALSTTVGHLILTHGVLAGIGAGYTVNPMFVTIGQYFDKYRGIACGLLACGTGIGILTGGSLVSLLLNAYGLKGTYLIWAGLMLHIVPAGMLLRPSQWEKLKKNYTNHFSKDISEPLIQSCGNSEMSFLTSCEGSKNQSIMSGLDKGSFARKDMPKSHGVETSLLKAVLIKRALSSSILLGNQIQVMPVTEKSSKLTHNRYISHQQSSASSTNPSACQSPSIGMSYHAPSNLSNHSPHSYRHQSDMILPASSRTPHMAHFSPISLRGQRMFHHSSQYHQSGRSHCSSLIQINKLKAAQMSSIGDHDNLSYTTIGSKIQKRELISRYALRSGSATTFMGSIMSVPAALAMVNDDISKYESKSIIDSSKSLKEHTLGFYNSLQLFRNNMFLIFITVCFFWAIGESPVIMYLPSFATDSGTSTIQASSLYTAMGLGSILGRFLASLASVDSDIGSTLLFTVSLFLAGASTVFGSLVASTFIYQVVFSGLLGLYTGALVPLSSLIILDMLDASDLGAGVGFLSLFQGIGYLIGPPLASFVINAIGYKNCFFALGCVLLFSSVGSVPLAINDSELETDDQLSSPDALHEFLEGDYMAEINGIPESKLPSYLSAKDSNVIHVIDNRDMSSKLLDIAEAPQRKDADDKLCTIQEILGK